MCIFAQRTCYLFDVPGLWNFLSYVETGGKPTALQGIVDRKGGGASGASNLRQGDALDTHPGRVTWKEAGCALGTSHHTHEQLPSEGLPRTRHVLSTSPALLHVIQRDRLLGFKAWPLDQPHQHRLGAR